MNSYSSSNSVLVGQSTNYLKIAVGGGIAIAGSLALIYYLHRPKPSYGGFLPGSDFYGDRWDYSGRGMPEDPPWVLGGALRRQQLVFPKPIHKG